MIFGFNTDIKHEDTVYHVQSEARQADLLLQTQVFVRGRCIGKRATSYAEKAADADFTDQKKEQILRDQHRLVLEAIRGGRLDDMIERIPEPVVIKPLDVQWINANSVHADHNLVMQLKVTEGGNPVEGARLTMRFARPDATPFYTQVYSDGSGNAEMKVEVDESALTDSSVLVQANYSGRTATRKFQLRKVVA
jgi:hypothetical protein